MTRKKLDQNNVEISLKNIGLTEHQAVVYSTLSKMGPSRAHKISIESGLKRALTYKILEQLEMLNLIESEVSQKDKVSIYRLSHPNHLEEIINSEKKKINIAENSYEEIQSSLISSFNLMNQKPNVRFWEGVDGLKKIYDDIIKEKKDIMLFRSAFDVTHQESRDLIRDSIKKQVARNIHTRAITPLIEPVHKAYTVDKDKINLVTRRFLKVKDFNIPAQIIIYGDKVAITSYRNNLINTIIDNKDISESLRSIFEIVWANSIHPKEIFGEYNS